MILKCAAFSESDSEGKLGAPCGTYALVSGGLILQVLSVLSGEGLNTSQEAQMHSFKSLESSQGT